MSRPGITCALCIIVLMAKTKKKSQRQSKQSAGDSDFVYILKLILYFIIGTQWFRLTKGSITIPIPIGFMIGVLLARTDRFGTDRKIDYAILVVSTALGFWMPIGFELAF